MKIIIAIVIFSAIILFHELGHFLFAKLNKIVVTEFSLGMGPRLYSFEKGDTRYSLKLLPIGGSCAMLGEDTDIENEPGTFNSASVWGRISVVAAGPVFNFIMAFVLSVIIVGAVGYEPSRVLSVKEGSAAEAAGLKEGDIITGYQGYHIDLGKDLYVYSYLNQLKEGAFDEEILLKNMIDTMLEEGNSRYPVYEENIDNIKGIVHYKDALKFMTQNPWAKFKPLKELPGIIRQASLIPETRGIGDLFHTMQARKIHMAIVVDEYGQTAGIVTMEDILEEIVGDILDEYDEDEITIRAQKDNSLIIDGLAYLEDVEEELDADFGDTEFETLNGYLTNILGHIPTDKDVDTSIKAIGYCFTILSIGNKTIGKVKVERDNNVAV